MENSIHENSWRIAFVLESWCREMPRNSLPSCAFLLFFMCTRAWHCFRCVLECDVLKHLGYRSLITDVYMQFDVACLYAAVYLLKLEMHACQVCGCVSKKVFVVTWPLLLCVSLQTQSEMHIYV